jgi:hypothetical protein
MSTVIDGSASVTINSGAILGITSGTAVASTSGTSITFSSIPSWVKRITVGFMGVSTNGTANIQVQLGVSATAIITGYLGGAWSSNTNNTAFTTGFGLTAANAATRFQYGNMTLTNMSGNLWTATGAVFDAFSSAASVSGGHISLGGVCDSIRIIASTTGAPADTFDAGSINILYE